MSVVYSLGTKAIEISDRASILIESKCQEVYKWDEVFYKIDNNVIPIGSYYTHGGSTVRREWMEYNNNTIVIFTKYVPNYLEMEDDDCDYDDSIHIAVMFDMKTGLFIEGSNEDLLEYYNQQFGKEEADKGAVTFQRRLLIRSKKD